MYIKSVYKVMRAIKLHESKNFHLNKFGGNVNKILDKNNDDQLNLLTIASSQSKKDLCTGRRKTQERTCFYETAPVERISVLGRCKFAMNSPSDATRNDFLSRIERDVSPGLVQNSLLVK